MSQQTAQQRFKLENSHYAYLSQLVAKDLENYKIGTEKYKDRNALLQFLKKKSRAQKAEEKEPSKWKCLSCDEIHEKTNQVRKCINCESEEVKKI